MDSFLSNQSSVTSHAVINFNSSSYGGFLLRSPNSPPPSPSPSPTSSVASLSQLFLDAKPGGHDGSRPAAYYFSPPVSSQLWQPPLLPFPNSATLPTPSKRIPASSIGTRRQNSKRKGKMFAGATKGASSPPTKLNDEVNPAIAALEVKAFEKLDSHPWPMEKVVRRSAEAKVTEEEDEMESVYSLSPPPSSLPIPRFSLTRPKTSGVSGEASGAGSCITEVAEVAGDAYEHGRILRI